MLPPGMAESDVRTFFFNTEVGRWQPLELVKVDTTLAW